MSEKNSGKQDYVYRFYTEDLMIRASVAITTSVVREMCTIQKTFPLATMGLGRALTGAVLLASQLKEEQQIGLQFNGDGPLGKLFAEANYEGQTRAYCHNGQVDLPFKDGRLDVGQAVGKGLLTVTRSMPFQKQPHSGIVPIVSGEIGEDLAHYLFQSHQIPSILALGVYLNPEGEVLAAGGVFLELMPGATESLIEKLEARAQIAGSLSKRILDGETPAELLRAYIHDSPLVASEPTTPITYTCKCSTQRVARTLHLLGKATLAEMIMKGDPVEVDCQFCGRHYTVDIESLRELHLSLAV